MVVITSSVATKAKPPVIWNRWIDVASWRQWNTSLDYARLAGGFRIGAHGELCMNKDKKASFVITRIEPDKMFEMKSQAWGNDVLFRYLIETVGGMQKMVIEVDVTGYTSWIFGFWLRILLKKELPACLTRLAFLVEDDQERVERELHSAHFKK